MQLETRCCVVGGGPAGMVLGWLLARAGVDVIVLEKHVDFLRDFRGDTVHPSTLELMHELGVLDEFLRVPHTRIERLDLEILNTLVPGPELGHLPTTCKFVAMMPQWDFLEFVRRQATALPTFRLILGAQATDLVRSREGVAGVVATTPTGRIEIRADLVVGADGRHSTIRELAALPRKNITVPIDVLWVRVPRLPSDGPRPMAIMSATHFLVMIDRGDYWQCAFLIEKGSLATVKRRGLSAFQDKLGALAPFLGPRVRSIASWDDIKLLTVVVDRMTRWWAQGVLCIGDAAHAMSPVGGVGINLAIQDAIAAANVLAKPLRDRTVTIDDLAAVEARREKPTRRLQRMQNFVHVHLLSKLLAGRGERVLGIFRFLLEHSPRLRRRMAQMIAVGQLEPLDPAIASPEVAGRLSAA